MLPISACRARDILNLPEALLLREAAWLAAMRLASTETMKRVNTPIYYFISDAHDHGSAHEIIPYAGGFYLAPCFCNFISLNTRLVAISFD